MTIRNFTLALKDFDFPLVSKMRGISIVIPSLDQEKESPQPIWVENIMPTSGGINTVEYTEELDSTVVSNLVSEVPELTSPDLRDSRIYTILTQEGDTTYYCVNNLYHFIYQPETNKWEVAENPTSLSNSTTGASVFNYKGRSLIFHPSLGLISYVLVAGEFVKLVEPLSGISPATIVSATSFGAYIIFADSNTIYWSSPLSGNTQGSVVEFNPGNLTLTGAGSSKALDLLGDILLLVGSPQGFYVYTEVNCIFAASTKQPSNPWFFSNVKNIAGGFNYNLVTHVNKAGIHFNWSDTGLVQVSQSEGQQQFPQITEFLTGTIWEDYNPSTKSIDVQKGATFEVKLKFLNGRYLCISYGKYSFPKEYILVLDTALQRWGKLKVDHIDIFDFIPPKRIIQAGSEFQDNLVEDGSDDYDQFLGFPYRTYLEKGYESNFRAMNIGILKPDFTTLNADFSEQTTQGDGLLIYGGISLTRSRLSQLNNIKLAGIYDPSLLTPEVKTPDTSSLWYSSFRDDLEDDYKIQTVGKEHLLKLEGKFQLSTIVVSVTQLGRM